MIKKQNALKNIFSVCPVFLAAFFLAPCAHSSSVIESEFELILPKQFQQNLIEEKWKSLANEKFKANWKFSDQVVEAQQGIKVHLNGLSLALQTQLSKPGLGQDQANLVLQSSDLQAQMVISEISVDQIVEQTVGGITGHFRIQAQCKNVVLNMRPGMGAFGISLKPAVGGHQIAAEVQDVDLRWQADAWQAQDFSCTGVEGFADLVNQQIQKISADSNSFVNPRKEQLVSYVKNYFANYSLDLSKWRELVSSRSDIKMNMIVDSFDDSNKEQMIAKGRLNLEFTRSFQEGIKKLLLSEGLANIPNSAQAVIRLPADFVKEVMGQAYSANSWVHSLYSSNLPGFSTIMNSRFVQFFVWPELMNYSKSSKFLFDIYSNKDPKIAGQGLQYQLNMNLLSRMQAPQSGKYIPFMNFVIPFNSKVNLAVSDSTLKVAFANTSLNLQYQWDSSYVNKYGPSKRFGASTIQSRILGAIAGKTMTVALPSIPVMEGLTLKIKKAQSLSNSDLLLQLAP
ncbi:hypothetical protein [Bdellovibrio svalbardensis]|uniref:Uncharacterized protein n=1 Tax=Bdellovibrio svalbardensis TaxID=2972972 RepID=A0ABT6DIF3_9BACT|nr:hypothetical protein [Bdellovibrio svalbardensis]MDG0816615.1 hypothetical protein [Bdellovibrio svalbardensis]